MKLNVLTLNILSSMTITPEWYPQTELNYLNENYRRNLLMEFLIEYINQDYIFCLQEISTKDWKVLKPFFESNNYLHVYQGLSSGTTRLGIAICFPSKYKLCSSHIVRVGEEIKKYIPNIGNNEEIVSASHDKRQIILVKLKINDTNVFVSTYHMPCKFLQQLLMEAQTMFCMKIINDIVGDLPVIFTGDFNSKYGEDVYKILTSNNSKSEFYWRVKELIPQIGNFFIDTLKDVESRLPTCYDQKNSMEYNLDYIFYRNLQLISSKLINHDFPIPNKTYFSDHLPIIASFNL